MKKAVTLYDRIEADIRSHKLIKERDHILVGFSGGADSTALLLMLWHLRSKLKIRLLAAHVNYNLRPDENKAELKFIQEFCFNYGIALLINHYDPSQNKGNENDMREYRMDWFRSLTDLYKIDKIALGHNKEDQAETVLYRLARGSMLTGLGGIRLISGNIIHPLLPYSRKEITEYLMSEKISWCEDSSNAENCYTRNKLRNVTIPWLVENINPKFVEKVSDTSIFLQQADDILKSTAIRKLQRNIIVRQDEREIRLDISELLKIEPVLRFYIYRYLYSQIHGETHDFYQSNFNEIENTLPQGGCKQIQLPNEIVLEKEYDQLIFYPAGKPQFDFAPEPPKELASIRHRFSFSKRRVLMKKLKSLPQKRNPYFDKNTIYLDYDKLVFPLTIRHREYGDRFIPFGMDGMKKLKDFFIDEKVPPRLRDMVILFCDSEKIFWVSGYRVDQRVAVTEKTTNILMIKLEKIKRRKSRPAERKEKR